MKVGILFQPKAWWIGVHYSDYTRRFCINLVPCLTVWICLEGGQLPRGVTHGKED